MRSKKKSIRKCQRQFVIYHRCQHGHGTGTTLIPKVYLIDEKQTFFSKIREYFDILQMLHVLTNTERNGYKIPFLVFYDKI